MIDFNQVESAVPLTADYVLSRVSEEQILFYYHGHFVLGKTFLSRLRKDSNPSAGFYIGKSGKIMYHDFKTNEYFNCFQYVGKRLNLRFNEVLNRIASDFGFGGNKNATPLAQHIIDQGIKFDREIKKETKIQFIPAKWNHNHLKYWAQYELNQEELIKENVFPVSKLFVNKRELKTEELCFAYLVYTKWKDVKNPYVKIYSPYSESMKWLSNVPLTVPFGIDNLVYGTDHLIITKAKKDMMVLKKLFPSVLGTQNESTSAISESLLRHLIFNFPRRTIIWDADETGVEACKKFNDKGFGYFNTPKELLEKDIKDVSDFVAAFGLKALKELLKQKQIL